MAELYTPESLHRVLLRVLVALGIDGLLLGVFVLASGRASEGWDSFCLGGLIISGVVAAALSALLVLVVIARILVGAAYRR